MKVLIPLVGSNNEFKEAGYSYIKSLIEIERKPLLQYVYESLKDIPDVEFIFIVRKDDVDKYHIDNVIKLLNKESKIVVALNSTQGAACTALLAIKYIDNDESLLIANGDQLLDIDIKNVTLGFLQKGYDGGVVTFLSVHPRWSFVRVDKNGYVIEAAEKRPISNYATAGLYYYKEGKSFVRSAKEMIMKDANFEGKYYICPTFNEMVLEQKRIGTYNIDAKNYYSFAIPKGIKEFEEHIRRQNYV